MKTLAVANALLSASGLYLAWLYGDLHWWYRDVRKTGLIDHELGLRFLRTADQLPIVAIVMTAAAAVSAIALWKSKAVGQKPGIALMILSLSCWVLSLAFWL